MNPLRPYIAPPPDPRRWRIRDVVIDTVICVGIFALPYLMLFGGNQ